MSTADFLEGSASVESLIRAVREYGEERRWRRVVDAIIAACVELVNFSEPLVLPSWLPLLWVVFTRSRQRIHPATKTFQKVLGLRLMARTDLGSDFAKGI